MQSLEVDNDDKKNHDKLNSTISVSSISTAPCCCRGSVLMFCYGMAHTFGPVGIASVLVWRSAWGLQDTYFFPNDKLQSAVASLFIGGVLGMIFHACQLLPNNHRTASSTHPNPSITEIGLVFLVSLCGICYWRGVWLLWDLFILPSYPLFQDLVGLIFGFGVLYGSGLYNISVVGPPIFFPSNNDNTLDPEDCFVCMSTSADMPSRCPSQEGLVSSAV